MMDSQIAKLIMPREDWAEMIGTGVEIYQDYFMAVFEHEEGASFNQDKMDKATKFVREEIMKLADEKYESALAIAMECIEEIYTEEELTTLKELWDQYPWILKKSKDLSVLLQKKMISISVEIAKVLQKNEEFNEKMNALMEEALDDDVPTVILGEEKDPEFFGAL